MPVTIWTYPGEGDRAEHLKDAIEDLEKKGTVGAIVPLQDSILIQWTPDVVLKRETRTQGALRRP